MTRARGNVLQNALARYLTGEGWPLAESAGAGRQGTDILNTLGLVWECKTAVNFRRDFRPVEWVEQSKGHAQPVTTTETGLIVPAEKPFTVYFPSGIGARNVAHTISMTPLHVQVQLLREAGYC